ncbi:uncharacterized protein LOC106770406 [Vigna radiata var. radiata]|uniref:Uncharacterized protein LOC106770406 n=1 Tax=Vigna radiata var. radiata TaxID=3916 RepID=A0A1S3V030_VIGRR|nr:uncharacterized protein LOC106770406 [Vigna radiata var. radiata]
MKEYRWQLGAYFVEKDDFIDAIRSCGVHNGRKLKLWKNDKRRISVKCYVSQGKCPWYAYCGYMSTQRTWQLRKIVDMHTCTREFKIGLVTSKWLSGRLEKSMKTNPDMKMTNLHNKFCKKYNIGVSRARTSRAKAMATTNIEGSYKQQYERLYDYAEELLRANPGSTVKINVEPNQDQTIFKRIYVCLKACKDNFLSCRPIIHLDGCFLKGKYGGELLTIIGRYANDQMCPLAFAVVEVENKESWTFFLELLIEDLGGGGFCSRCTFMSDQQKGLLPVLQSLLPDVDQHYCVRHIYSNFRKKFPGLNLRQLLWKAAVSTTPEAWEHWSRSRFTGRPACDTLVNNIFEGFNSVILDAREKPIISMLEEIQMYLMNSWSGMQIFQITHTSIIVEKYVVDVEKRECTCRKWTITGIPCCHALTAMRTSTPDIQPPPKRVLPGRPRKKRRPESWEQRKDDTQIGQKGIPKKCSICREVRHRRPNYPQANQQQPQEGTPHQKPVPDQEPTSHQEATLHPTQGSQITEQTQPDQTTTAI